MKKVACMLVLLSLLLTLCACSSPWSMSYDGVFEGDFTDGTVLRVIEGPKHNQGWYCEAQIIHADGTVQRMILNWGHGELDLYAWRDVIDHDRMTRLYSGEYRFNYPASDKMTLTLDTGEKFVLKKTDQDPMAYSFEAKSPMPTLNWNQIENKYTDAQIGELGEMISAGDMTFARLQQQFTVELMENTYQEEFGYYVLLLRDDGSRVFVFVSYDLIVTDVMVVDDFLTKTEFEEICGAVTSKSAILKADPNAMDVTTADAVMTAHIVREGVFLVTYSTQSEDPQMDSVLFVENKEQYQHENTVIQSKIPFIKPEHKTAR